MADVIIALRIAPARVAAQERLRCVDIAPAQSSKVVRMRSVAIIFCAALFVGLPTISHAQYNDNDQQNPKEYHDEDSQPLALFADIIYPLGYGLEWLVARPAHWLANDSAAAPVFRPVGGRDMLATAAGADHSRQHDGPGDDLDDAAGLVSDAATVTTTTTTVKAGRTAGGSSTAVEQSAGTSLKFRGSPRNIAIDAILPSAFRGYLRP